MRKRLFTALALAVAFTPALASAAQAAGEWQDGTSSSDTIINCPTQTPGIGTSANVGWRSPTGEVPKVGEKFYLRAYIGLISMPCSTTVATVPEVLAPPGVEFVEEPTLWDIYKAEEGGTLTSGGLEFYRGVNQGAVITQTGDEPFVLHRGEILEFQFPVRATRALKGTATRAPTCLSRRDGTKPCPVSESGDHLQVAFAVGGHGGDKSYVTPYVPLFAAGPGGSGAPRVSISGGPGNGSVATSPSASFNLAASSGASLNCTLDGRAQRCATGRHTVGSLRPGTHQLRATARNGGASASATRTWTVPVPAKSLKRKGKWSLSRASAAYGGQVLTSKKRGATASIAVRGAKRLALVAGGGRGHGTVKVYAGSRLVKKVKLSASRTVSKRVIKVASFAKAWTGTVRIVVASSGRPVRLEGVAAVTR